METVRSSQVRRNRRFWSILVLGLVLSFLLPWAARPAHAEGSKELVANGGARAQTEWRTGQYANAIRRRTFLQVYANAGEKINLGSSAAGVGSGDIVVWNPGIITSWAVSQQLTLPAYSFSCKASQPTKGKLTTRAQELAGPLPNANGYDPCIYTAATTGVYWVGFYGPSGDGTDTAASSYGTIASPIITTAQNSTVSMWDITVRNSDNTVTYPGRVYTAYLVQQTGSNGTAYRVNSTLYSVTRDGFRYQVDMRGLDPNAYVFYGNTVGFLNPDGITPLYHDLYDGTNDSLTAPRGGVTVSPPTGILFFNQPDATLPASIVPTPLLPSVSSIVFEGTAGPNLFGDGVPSSFLSTGGNFVYSGNVGGVAEVVIAANPGTCANANYDPNLATNRALRAALPGGVQNLAWNGKDNNGTNMPLSYPGNSGLGYCFKATLHAGEYHFPLLDAENSMLGGPTITLLNPPGGTCPLATCRTAFFDDRGYRTTNGTIVGTLGAVLPGNNPPPAPYYSMDGFDTASTTVRKFGNDGSTGFGDKKGMDLWTYYPSPDVVGRLYVVPQGTSDLAILKTHSGDFIAGQNNIYTISVKNVGTGSIAGTITVNDTVPSIFPVQSVSGASPWTSCTFSGQVVTCTATNAGGLAAGASMPDIILTVKPNYPTDYASTSATNTATVANANDTNPANNSSSSPTTISSADLKVEKTANPANPVEGAAVTYTIKVTNNGPSVAEGISVAEAIPAGLTYGSYTASQGLYDGATWTVGSLLSGGTATLTLNATVNVGQSGQTIGNTATVSGGPYDFVSSNNSATASLSVPPTVLTGIITDERTGLPLSGATVVVTDSLGRTFTVVTGTDGRYTVTGSPGAPLAAGPAAVSASKAGYVAASANPTVVAGTTTTQNLALTPLSLSGVVTDQGTGVPIVGAKVTFTQGSLVCTTYTGPGGTYSFVHSAECPLVAGPATVEAEQSAYQEAEASVTILSTGPTTQNLALTTADLLITKTDGLTAVLPGQQLVYTIHIVNQGTATATGIVIEDTVGPYLTFVSDDSGLTREDLGSGKYRWTGAPDRPPGQSFTFYVTVQVASSLPDGTTSLTNYVYVSTTTPEKDKTNNEVQDTDTVTAHPDLTLAKALTSSPPARKNTVATFRLSGGNVGHATATAVTIVDTLDAQLTYNDGTVALSINGSPATPTSVSYDAGTHTLTVGLPNLAPGDTYILTYAGTVSSNPGAYLVNSAAISEVQTDGNPADNTAGISVPTSPERDVWVVKSAAANPSPSVPGGQIVYTLAYGNLGSQDAANVTITDPLPPNTTFVSATGGGTYNAGTVTWSLGTLVGGASGSVSFTVQINSPLPAGVGALLNTASIATTNTDPNLGNNTSTTSTSVVAQPDLVVTKTDGKTQVLAGDALQYTLTYENRGNQAAAGVTVVDTLLNGVTYVSSSPAGTYNAGPPETVTWAIGSLPVDGPHTLTVNVLVKADALPGSVAANRVAIADDGANGADPNPGDNTATDSDLVIAPYIVLEKTVASPAYVGENLTYTIAWHNTGAAAAKGVVIQDTLPANVTFVSADSGGTYDSGTRTITWNLGDKDPDASGTLTFVVTVEVGAGGAFQTLPTLSTETGSGSVTVTSSTSALDLPWCELDKCRAFRNRYQGADGTPQAGWNDNPRLTAFDDTGWTQPGAASTKELIYWLAPENLSAQWVAPNADGHLEGNFTFFRQAFCLPLNATGLSANLQLAGDDVSDIFLNGVYLGQEVGAGGASSFDGAPGIQSGINILAVQLLNNRHGGHPIPDCPGCDHIGLLFNLGAAYTGLRPFASAPAMALAGQTLQFSADEAAIGGRRPYVYKFDFGDGTVIDYQSSATYPHAYALPGTYTATITARAQYGCTGTDTVIVTVLPADGSLLANPATAAYQDAYGHSFTCQTGAGAEVRLSADLSAVKTVTSGGTVPGEGVAYQVVVTNLGPNAVTGASLADTVPATVTGVTWTCAASGGGSCAHGSGSGNAIDETVDLPKDATATFTIQGTIDPAATGTLANTATVAPPSGVYDRTPGNNSSTASTTLAPRADLSLSKSSSPNPATAGLPIAYTLTVHNAGPSTVTALTLLDNLPAAVLGAVYEPGAGTFDPATGAWTGLSLAAGQQVVLHISAALALDFQGTLQNTAEVAPVGATDPNAGNNQASDSNTVKVTADLELTKTSSPIPYTPGSAITYILTVRNNGPSAVTSLTLIDTVPAAVENPTYTPGAGSYNPATGAWTGLSLGAGQTVQLTIAGTVAAGTSGYLLNTASVAPPGGVTDPYPDNNQATDINGGLDYGDLPENYGDTLLAQDGARHYIGTLWLGTCVTAEGNGQPHPEANADGCDNGVTYDPAGTWVPGYAVPLTVNVHGGGGYLVAWIDWSNDGDFDDPEEMVVFGDVSDGANSLNLTVGERYLPGLPVVARFRLFDGNPGVSLRTGLAVNGEVEDYRWTVPTSVKLKRFLAWPEGAALHVEWETSEEIDNLGFNLYRSDAENPWLRLNETLIPTKVPPGSPFGATYVWLDETVAPGTLYTYWLEAVDLYGVSEFFGPVQASLPDAGPAVHVRDIRLAARQRNAGVALRALIRVADEYGGRVAGATVAVRWTLPDGSAVDQQALSGQSGGANFRLQATSPGLYTLCVTGLTLEGYAYNPSQNGETCDGLIVP